MGYCQGTKDTSKKDAFLCSGVRENAGEQINICPPLLNMSSKGQTPRAVG